jgi:hypothetical protein
LTASFQGWVTCWEIESGNRCGRFHTEGEMSAIAISPDGRTVIAGENIGRVHILRMQGNSPTDGGSVRHESVIPR